MFTCNIIFAAPPKYSLSTDYLEAPAGTTPTVTFIVTSDPPLADDTEHTLSRRGREDITRRFRIEDNCIMFRKVRVEDSGMYTISCCDDEREVVQATIELEIMPKSEPLTEPAGKRAPKFFSACFYGLHSELLVAEGREWWQWRGYSRGISNVTVTTNMP